jgi:hypothetical protein
MRISVALLGVFSFLVSDYLADTIPIITILDQQINSKIIFMPILFFVPLIIISLLEKHKKNPG